jgi:hypothetical protein
LNLVAAAATYLGRQLARQAWLEAEAEAAYRQAIGAGDKEAAAYLGDLLARQAGTDATLPSNGG